MALCSCDMFWCRDDAHKDGRCARPAAANGSRCSQCEGQTTGPTRVSVPNAAQRLRAASSVPTALGRAGPARGLSGAAMGRLNHATSVASAVGNKGRATWKQLPKGQQGTDAGLYQISNYYVKPPPVVELTAKALRKFEKGTQVRAILYKGATPLVDDKGKNVGFESGDVLPLSQSVTFDKLSVGKLIPMKRAFEAHEKRFHGAKGKRGGPFKQGLYTYSIRVETVATPTQPSEELSVLDPFRFEVSSALRRIDHAGYRRWRKGATELHNKFLKKEEEPASSSAGSSAVAPATIRSPHTFGTDTIHFQLAGDIRNPLQVDPTTEVRFSALVEAIVGSLVAIGRCSMREESLDVEYEQTLASNLKEGLANPAQTQLFFGGQLLTPEDMTPLTSIIERARVVVIVAAEAVVKDFDILRGKRSPLDDHPVTGYEPLFLDEDSFDGTVPMASNASVELVHVKEEERDLPDVIIELAGVKQEHAEEKVCVKKEEEDRFLRQDVALLQEFFLRLPAQRVGSIVQRVGSTNTRGVVVEANESDPCEVHVLFEEEDEVESNLKVGENLLLVELSFSE